MSIVLARVDNRLIHGQVLESWIPRLKVSTILVVDDGVADDSLRQAIMEIAVPSRIRCNFLHVREAKSFLDNDASNSDKAIVLFSEIRDALEVIRQGVMLACLNIGNVHFEEGKRRITQSVSLNDEEICWLAEIDEHIPVDVRATPDDPLAPFKQVISGANIPMSCPEAHLNFWDRWPMRLLKKRSASGCGAD